MMHQSPSSVDAPLSLRVNVASQKLEVCRGGLVEKSYPISTSKYGLGTTPGSLKTPLGRFRIGEKIGADAPCGMVFKGRQPTGTISLGGGEDDLILTRILWLEGLDEDNSNTRDRYIYIHGTNQEDRIGEPSSHGCVRMRNADIIDLFEQIPEGTSLEILA